MKSLPFKAGAFKAATRAKAPIVPVALLDSYAPFDRSTTETCNCADPLYETDVL